MIQEKTLVAASDGIETAELDGEAVILDVNSGQYYGLSSVGAKIMDLLREPILAGTIVDRLHSEYEVEIERLTNDTLTFLTEMNDRSLIRVISSEVG